MTEKLVDLWASVESNETAANISAYCPPSLNNTNARWIVPLGQCVTNARLYAAFIIGISSILFWFVAQAPQLITNCRSGKADKALSFWFLLQWYAGDTTNLIGAILTRQLTTQIVAAIYYVIIDTVMMTQFLYYVIKNQGPRGESQSQFLSCHKIWWYGILGLVPGLINCFKCPKRSAILVLFPCLALTLVLGGPFQLFNSEGIDNIRSMSSGRHLLSKQVDQQTHIVEDTPVEIIGYSLGIISAIFYLGSRVPQIIKNFMRCSTDGLSIPMFVLAVMGNVTYALAVFMVSVKPIFLLRKLPWLVGSVGTLCFDFTVFMQYIFFKFCCKRKRTRKTPIPDEYSSLLPDSPVRRPRCSVQALEHSVKLERSLAIPRNEPSIISSYYVLPSSI